MSIKTVLSDAINKAKEFSSFADTSNTNGFNSTYDGLVDGNGLPTTKTKNQYEGTVSRNLITWLVPEFGTVKMFINPQSISYNYGKEISNQRTKGGYSLQYWGETLPTLSIRGTSGSSGIEGINLLYEIYRAEQYAFDGQALTLEANNYDLANYANTLASQAVDGIFGANTNGFIEKIGGTIGKELLGTAPDSVVVENSLAQFAFTVEMYYNGAVFRGFFTKFSIEESADNFNFNYSIDFTVTQQRGYRKNFLPFHKNTNSSLSRYSEFDAGGNSPDYSFKRNVRG